MFALCKELQFISQMIEFATWREYGSLKCPVLCDNKSAISMAQCSVATRRTKHMAVRYYYVKECSDEKRIDISYVHTGLNLADALTKPVARRRLTLLMGSP